MSLVNRGDLEEIINEALNDLYNNDYYLIFHKPEDNYFLDFKEFVCERAIVFRLGLYLQGKMSRLEELSDLNLDCEYNRDINNIKTLPSFSNGSYPDLIIHKRGCHNKNILVMEIKTWWNPDSSSDKKKIEELMSLDGHYKYRFGVCILIAKDRQQCKLDWL